MDSNEEYPCGPRLSGFNMHMKAVFGGKFLKKRAIDRIPEELWREIFIQATQVFSIYASDCSFMCVVSPLTQGTARLTLA